MNSSIYPSSCSANTTLVPQHSSTPIMNSWKQGAPSCERCCNPIYDPTLVSSNNKFWHKTCFRCSCCQKELNEACFSNGKEHFCQADFTRLYRSSCASCSANIDPTEIVRRIYGNLYHESCFKCTMCEVKLQTGDRVYLRDDNKLICMDDYGSLHSNEGRDSPLHPDNYRKFGQLSEQQLDTLSEAYNASPWPSYNTRQRLGTETGLDGKIIQEWFQEKRTRDKNLRLSGSFCRNPTDQRKDPDWLFSAMSPDCVPPNVDLTPEDIRNGEVFLPNMQGRNSRTVSLSFMEPLPRQWLSCS